ncbi:MAG: HI1506-related protein [Pseudomonadota bacterium]
MAKITITAKIDGWRRCGVVHTAKPRVWDAEAFTEEEWTRIAADPRLVVVEGNVAGAEPADADATAPPSHTAPTFEERIAAAIADLGAGDFSADGKPKVSAIQDRMKPDERRAIFAELRDRIFAEMVKDGFKPPAAE